MQLDQLRIQLERFTRGELDLSALQAWIAPILAADPLDVAESASAPWEAAPEDTRLFWRLVYLLEVAGDEETVRGHATRIVACLRSTRDASVTYEMLPLLLDQERLTTIVGRHIDGIISRTGFLNVVAESGYSTHMKRWLERASAVSLERLVMLLTTGAYREVAASLNQAPG